MHMKIEWHVYSNLVALLSGGVTRGLYQHGTIVKIFWYAFYERRFQDSYHWEQKTRSMDYLG